MTAPIPPAPRSATTPARASQNSRTTSISPATKATPRPSCSSPTSASSTASTPTCRPPAPATAPSEPPQEEQVPHADQLPVPPDVRERRIADGAVRRTLRRRLRHGDSEEQRRATQLKKNAVTSAKINEGAVASLKVKDHSLLAKDFKTGQLPVGPQGPTGDTGAKGDTGTVDISKFFTKTESDGRYVGQSDARPFA